MNAHNTSSTSSSTISRTFRPLRADRIRNSTSSALLKSRGFFVPGIIADWEHIAGKELAACSSPLRMVTRPIPGGETNTTLYIALFRAPMAMALQMAEPVILERLAVYSGHKRANKLVIKHFFSGPERRRDIKRIRRPHNETLRREAADILTDIEDEALAKRLQSLADTLYHDI